MGLISTLKELLGMETREPKRRHDVEVTVERKADTESERAVKEPVASATSSTETEESAGTDTTETTSPEPETGSAEAESESAETGGEDGEDAGAETAETDDANASASAKGESESETAEQASGEDSEKDTAADEPVKSIKGIGSAYAERLGNAGVETVGQLAEADPETVAADGDLPQARLEDWIERAKSRL